MTFHTMALVILTLAPSEGSNDILPLDGLRTAIIIDRKEWTSSVDICKEKYTDLITIYDEKDNERVFELLKTKSAANSFIGLKNGNSIFKWSNGDPYNYTKIDSNDTNICVAMKADGAWEQVNCCLEKPFICYSDEPVHSSRYHLITEVKNWSDAVSYCRKHFTDLVSIRNEEQNREVETVKRCNPNNTWIGLMRDSWEWSDKGLSTYRNWAPNEPHTTSNIGIFTANGWKTFSTAVEGYGICYKDHIHISNESMTWEESLDYCRSFNGSFCILTKHEQVAAERLMKRLNIKESVWVGLEHNSFFGFWVWTTGVTVVWNNWEGGQSPQLPLSHHCGALRSAKDDFKWKDMNCRTRLRAVCFDWIV